MAPLAFESPVSWSSTLQQIGFSMAIQKSHFQNASKSTRNHAYGWIMMSSDDLSVKFYAAGGFLELPK